MNEKFEPNLMIHIVSLLVLVMHLPVSRTHPHTSL